MATPLDLQEQEQLDALKSFWNQYGNLITWTLVVALGGFAAWNGWNWYQRDQGVKAGALFEELDRAATVGDADKTARAFKDMQDRFPKTALVQQGGLTAAKLQVAKGQADAAKATLAWVATNGSEEELRTVARLRLAAVQADAKQFDDAIKTLDAIDAAKSPSFAALIADRRGDILLAQGKKPEAAAAWQSAYAAMSDKVDYRRLIEAKLVSVGAPPAAAASAASASAASSGAKP